MHQLNSVPLFGDLSSINPNVKAILWDMDGTIMQTELLHTLSTMEILKIEHEDVDINFKEIDELCVGSTDKVIFDCIKQRGFLANMELEPFIDKKNLILKDLLSEIKVERIFNAQVESFLGEVQKMGIKQAVVTSSEKMIANTLLSHLNLERYFDLILTREDTSENKPSPVPYLKAMDLLNVAVGEVIIFEDSPTGLQAAKDSNAQYCKVTWYN